MNEYIKSIYTQKPQRGIISYSHQYHRVDLNLIWRVVVKDIPELKDKIHEIIQTTENIEKGV